MKPELLRLAAQDPYARAVEGHDPHRVGARADQLLDALLHLARGLVGEGDREDLPGVHAAGRQEVGDAVGEHPGLAGARAGDDEQGRARVHHGRALLLVQPVEQGRRVDHRARGAAAVVGVAVHGRVETAPEEVVRHRFGCVRLLGRRRVLLLGGLEVRQEAVVKEAAHRLPSLGCPTDSPRPPSEASRYPGETFPMPPAYTSSEVPRRLRRHTWQPHDHPETSRTVTGRLTHQHPRTSRAQRSRKRIGHIGHQPSHRSHTLASVLRRQPVPSPAIRAKRALPAPNSTFLCRKFGTGDPLCTTGVNRAVRPRPVGQPSVPPEPDS